MHMEFQAVVFAAGKGSRFPEVIFAQILHHWQIIYQYNKILKII